MNLQPAYLINPRNRACLVRLRKGTLTIRAKTSTVRARNAVVQRSRDYDGNHQVLLCGTSLPVERRCASLLLNTLLKMMPLRSNRDAVHAMRVGPGWVARRVHLSHRELNGGLCPPDTVVLSLITQEADGAIESAMHCART